MESKATKERGLGMKQGKGGMKKDNTYQLMCGDKFTRMSLAICQEDYEYFSEIAKSTKINRRQFILLCHTAINTKRTSVLKAVLDSYHSFWTQDVFNDLTSYVMSEHLYDFLSFLDGYIDKVNQYHQSINDWNEYIADKEKKEAEQAEKDKRWYRKIWKKFLKILPKRKKK